MSEFVASCSTLPARVDSKRFEKTVLKFAKHPKISVVYIHYPAFCERLKLSYPPVPDWMRSHPKIVVNTNAEDTGPATKFHGLCELLPAHKPFLGIILFDDDRIYSRKWIEDLMNAYEMHRGEACVGYQGTICRTKPFMINRFRILAPEDRTKEDPVQDHDQYMVIKTASLAIYCRKVLPTNNQVYKDLLEKYKDDKMRNNDDIGLAHLAYKAQVPIYIIPIIQAQHDRWLVVNNDRDNPPDSLSRLPSHVQPQIKLVRKMILNGDINPPHMEIATTVFAVFVFIFVIWFCIALTSRNRTTAKTRQSPTIDSVD